MAEWKGPEDVDWNRQNKLYRNHLLLMFSFQLSTGEIETARWTVRKNERDTARAIIEVENKTKRGGGDGCGVGFFF